jgi:adenylate cyclase
MRLNPYHPQRFWNHLGRAHYTARQYSEAVALLSRIARPECTHHALLAASLAQLGDKTAAGAHVQEVLRMDPGFSIQRFLSTWHYQLDSDRNHLREGLVKAGLPESW